MHVHTDQIKNYASIMESIIIIQIGWRTEEKREKGGERGKANTTEQSRRILLKLLHLRIGLLRLLTERNITVFHPATHRTMDLLVPKPFPIKLPHSVLREGEGSGRPMLYILSYPYGTGGQKFIAF